MNPFSPFPRRPWLRRLGFAAAVLCTLIVFFYAEENWRAARAWSRAQAEVKAAGLPTTYETLLPRVPDAENFYAAPIARERFRLDKAGAPWLPLKEGVRISDCFETAVSDEGVWDYAALLKWLRENATWPLPPETGNTAADLLMAMAPMEEPWRELEAAVARPQAVPLAEDLPAFVYAGANFIFPVDTARYFDIRTRLFLEAGDPENSFDSTLYSLQYAKAVSSHPVSLMNFLLASAVKAVCLSSVQQPLAKRLWSEPQLAKLETALAEMNAQDSLLKAWQGEIISHFRISAEEAGFFTGFRDPNRPQTLTEHAWEAVNRMPPSGWFNGVKSSGVDYLLKSITAARQGGLTDAAQVPVESPWRPAFNVFPGYSSPGSIFQGIIFNALQTQAECHLLRASIAAERYRIAHGAFPAALTELPGVPEDPFTQAPLKYVKNPDGGITLSSSGKDAVDPADDITAALAPPPA